MTLLIGIIVIDYIKCVWRLWVRVRKAKALETSAFVTLKYSKCKFSESI